MAKEHITLGEASTRLSGNYKEKLAKPKPPRKPRAKKPVPVSRPRKPKQPSQDNKLSWGQRVANEMKRRHCTLKEAAQALGSKNK
jgi:hypothetical protein